VTGVPVNLEQARQLNRFCHGPIPVGAILAYLGIEALAGIAAGFAFISCVIGQFNSRPLGFTVIHRIISLLAGLWKSQIVKESRYGKYYYHPWSL